MPAIQALSKTKARALQLANITGLKTVNIEASEILKCDSLPP